MLSFCFINIVVLYTEDITRWREDMNFIFEWQEQCLSERVRYFLFNILLIFNLIYSGRALSIALSVS